MSLKVWLPLNGTLDNQGLDTRQISQVGTGISITDGKIGKCFQFPNNCASYIHMPGFNLQTGSWAAWIKVLGEGAKPRQCLMSEGRDSYSDGVEFYTSQNGTTLSFKAHKIILSTSIELNKWYHIVGTFGDNLVKLYIDGVLIKSGSYTEDMTYEYSDNRFVLGKMSFHYTENGNYFPYNGMLNDVRIYDHVLSLMEVKELSKGLVLHYPLNRNGWGQENLLTKITSEFSNWTNINPNCVTVTSNDYKNVFLLTQGVGGKWENVYSPAISVEANKEYTISCLYKVYDNYNFTSSYGDFGLTVMKAIPTNTNPISNTIARASFKNVSGGFWKAQATFIPTVTTIYLNMCGGSIVDGQTDKKFDVNYIKLEEGSIATPWCPNSSDALATTMGLNDNVEYDTSGYGNNGIRAGTFNWTSDTLKYNVSTNILNGSYIDTGYKENIGTGDFTVSVWIKMPQTSGKSYQPIFSNKITGAASVGFAIYFNQNQNKLLWSTADGSAATEIWMANTINIYDKWTHIVMVRNASDAKKGYFYINGERYELVSVPVIRNITNETYNIQIGDIATHNNSAYRYVGLMSDFRIYATALSADDIKSLYQNSAYIDNQGNIYGAVYEEV